MIDGAPDVTDSGEVRRAIQTAHLRAASVRVEVDAKALVAAVNNPKATLAELLGRLLTGEL